MPAETTILMAARHRAPEDDGIAKAIAVVTAMRHAVAAASGPFDWSGPEDGSAAGVLECADGLEIGVHAEAGGLHVDATYMVDVEAGERGGRVGTVVDARASIEAFDGVEGAAVPALLLPMLDGWLADLARATAFRGPDAPAHLMDGMRAASRLFAAASVATGLVEPEFMVACVHPATGIDPAATGNDRPTHEWTLASPVIDAVTALLPPALVYRLECETDDHAVVRIAAYAPMPVWEGPLEAVDVLRTLAEHGVGSAGMVDIPNA